MALELNLDDTPISYHDVESVTMMGMGEVMIEMGGTGERFIVKQSRLYWPETPLSNKPT